MKKELILGIDGGGTKTTCILFDSQGMIIDSIQQEGSNIYVFKEKGVATIMQSISHILQKNKLNYLDVNAYGIGLAGISDLNYKEVLIKEFDRNHITKRTLFLSDAEAAFRVLCPTNIGILVNIGTGIICFARDSKCKMYKTAGRGYDKGDKGSGYWLGKKLLSKFLINEAIIMHDDELLQIFDLIRKKFNCEDIKEIYKILEDKDQLFKNIASLGEITIDLAESGNDIALAIVQEGTRHASDYIIDIVHRMGIKDKKILLSVNGSIIENNFYRKLLEDSLMFDFHEVKWLTSVLSPAYGAGLISANYNGINIALNNLVDKLKN